MDLFLIRHGESKMNAGLSDEMDCALTVRGMEQAKTLARRLREAIGESMVTDWVGVVSPYRRAMQTAAIVTDFTGLHFEIDEAVREWGKTADVCGRIYEEEPIEVVVNRLREFIERRVNQRVVMVAHATPIALLTHLCKGEPLNTRGRFWESVENCCLRRVGWNASESRRG